MNKRILMLIGIIFCVFITFVNPMNVSADEVIKEKVGKVNLPTYQYIMMVKNHI